MARPSKVRSRALVKAKVGSARKRIWTGGGEGLVRGEGEGGGGWGQGGRREGGKGKGKGGRREGGGPLKGMRVDGRGDGPGGGGWEEMGMGRWR